MAKIQIRVSQKKNERTKNSEIAVSQIINWMVKYSKIPDNMINCNRYGLKHMYKNCLAYGKYCNN